MRSRAHLLVSIVILVSGCADDQSGTEVTPEVLLTATTELPDGTAECLLGGSRVDIGFDNGDGGGTAGDGVLQDGEVDETEIVCNGESGVRLLAVSTEIPFGDTDCPLGGSRIEVGLDDGDGDSTPGDGVLQPGEVDITETLCNEGEEHEILYVTSVLFQGNEECPFGGLSVEVGLDDGDGNGTADDGELHEDEVDLTRTRCAADPSSGRTILTEITSIPVGDGDCAFGGAYIELGLDNGDGEGTANDDELHPDEVDETEILCNDDPGEDHVALTEQALVTSGDAHCPFGGTRIDFGLDNGDGDGTEDDEELHEDEIDGSEHVCLDAEAGLLVVVEELPWGDEDCPTGGQRLVSGLDDGRGEGEAGDHVLHPDEVRDTQLLCHVEVSDVFEPVTGALSGSSIDLSGGASDDAVAGRGGSLTVEVFAGPLAASIEMLEIGLADASFEAPTAGTPEPGAHPAVVDAAVTVTEADGASHPAGLHLWTEGVSNEPYPLYLGDDLVTSLHIQEAGRLYFDTGDSTEVGIHGDVLNEGLLSSSPALAELANGIEIYSGSFVNAETGVVQAIGTAESDRLEVYAIYGDNPTISNAGSIDTSGDGSDPSAPGASGGVVLFARGDVFNTGTIDASGADADGSATDGSEVIIASEWGDVYHSGVIDTSGGDGASGGDGGDILVFTTDDRDGDLDDEYFELDDLAPGHFTSSGDMSAAGGTGISGAGGAGGDIFVLLLGGDVLSSGDMSAAGGDSAAAAAGYGGSVTIVSHLALDDAGQVLRLPTAVTISGNIWLSGGKSVAGTGGAGGGVNVFVDLSLTQDGGDAERGDEFSVVRPFNLEQLIDGSDVVRVQLLGYGGGVNTSAGAGSTSQTISAGSVRLENGVCVGPYPNCALSRVSSRWIINTVNVTAKGGSSASGRSGHGGNFTLAVDGSVNLVNAVRDAALVENHGDVTLSGGSSPVSHGGHGGDFRLASDVGRVVNTAGVVTDGGASGSGVNASPSAGSFEMTGGDVAQSGIIRLISGGGDGGYGGQFELIGFSVINQGPVLSEGSSIVQASGYARAGSGGDIYLAGTNVTNSAKLTTRGGSAIATENAPGSYARPGNPGDIEIVGGTVTNRGQLSANPGTAHSTHDEVLTYSRSDDLRLRGQVVRNTGTINVNGGQNNAATGISGSSGGNVAIVGDEVTNTASVFANGGTAQLTSGVARGDGGGSVLISGDNTGNIQCNGGALIGGGTPSQRHGGEIRVGGDNSGCLQVNAGPGGDAGTITVDGTDTGSCL